MNTKFPYKDQLEQIGDHSIEEVMHLQLVNQIESDTTKLDEFDEHLDEITYLYGLRDDSSAWSYTGHFSRLSRSHVV